MVYLENPEGRFVLLPSRKIFADLDSQASPLPSPLESVELGLEQTRGEATYEALGNEPLGGRNTTKYRVRNGNNQSSETLLWIDEQMRIPIRSETKGVDSNAAVTVVTELRDLKTEVDATLFTTPSDYKKVDNKTLRDEQNKAP
jgi:hypothetical protein